MGVSTPIPLFHLASPSSWWTTKEKLVLNSESIQVNYRILKIFLNLHISSEEYNPETGICYLSQCFFSSPSPILKCRTSFESCRLKAETQLLSIEEKCSTLRSSFKNTMDEFQKICKENCVVSFRGVQIRGQTGSTYSDRTTYSPLLFQN